MELSRRTLISQRTIAVATLALALAAAWGESGATLPASIRASRPWLSWVEARESPTTNTPSFILAAYEPTRRKLGLLHIPPDFKIEERRTLEQAYDEAFSASNNREVAARATEDLLEAKLHELSAEPFMPTLSRLTLKLPSLADDEEPSVAVAHALKTRTRSARAWWSLLRQSYRHWCLDGRTALDGLLFFIELRRVLRQDMEPARLANNEQASQFLGRFLSFEQAPQNPRATTVEILNGSQSVGLASHAAKMLRSRGIDVLSIGSTAPRTHTLVYDRIGDFKRATDTVEALGCPRAHAAVRLDETRAVDVSVELGTDCIAGLKAH